MGRRIAEVAELTGLPASTIRYYEDEGLLQPAARESNGYRIYGDRDVARLRFVARARRLDLSVAELRALVELWEDDECAGVAGQLRQQVAVRLAETQGRIGELMSLAGELREVATRLEQTPHPGRCDENCVCVASPAPDPGLPLLQPPGLDATEVACTLDPAAMPQRVTDWQHVLAGATGREPIPDGVSVRFPLDTSLAAEIVDLAAAEHRCCAFFDFSLRVTADALHLDVRAPADAAPVLAAVFGRPGPSAAAS